MCLPFAVYYVYWEHRRNRLLEEELPALRSRFQGDTPFYGKLWGYATDYFLETSLQDGDLVFFSKDSHSLPFSSAFSRAFLHFLLSYIIPSPSLSDDDKKNRNVSFKNDYKENPSSQEEEHSIRKELEKLAHGGESRSGSRRGGGLSIDEVGIIYVENGQRYVITVSSSSSVSTPRRGTSCGGLVKKKYADQIAESFAEGIWVRRLRCSRDVRDRIHQALNTSLSKDELEHREKETRKDERVNKEKQGGDIEKEGGEDQEDRQVRPRGEEAGGDRFDFSDCRVSQWKSFLVEVNRRYSKETYRDFRGAAMRIFLERRKRSAMLLQKRFDDLLQDVETTAPRLIQLAQHRLCLQSSDDRQTGQSMTKTDEKTREVDGVKEEKTEEKGMMTRREKEHVESRKYDDENKGGNQSTSSSSAGCDEDDEVSIVEDLLLCKEYAGRAVNRMDAILKAVQEDERLPCCPSRKKKFPLFCKRVASATFPASIYQAAGLLPSTPDPGVWTPEDLLAIDLLLQPREDHSHDLSARLGSQAKDVPRVHEEEKSSVTRGNAADEDLCVYRKTLAKQSAIDVLSLSPQFAPILYVRGGGEEKGERDSQFRTNMPALIRQRERKNS